jgi:selenocysteine lyase/cysteine desulfurase
VALGSSGAVVKYWDVDRDAMALDLAALERLLSTRTRLVAVTHSSNILGAAVPVAEVARLAHAHGAAVCVDGVAWAPHRAMDVRAWDVDYYVWSCYKVYGPHHAVLYGKHARLLELASQYHYFVGKDQVPYKLQPGNPNYELSYGAAGIADYLVELGERARTGAVPTTSLASAPRRAHLARAFDAIAAHESALAERLLAFLRDRRGVRLIGPESSDPYARVPTISFVVDGVDSETIVRHIDGLGIGIRFGHFHSKRLIDDLDLAGTNGVVRVSMVHYNTLDEVDRLVAGLDEALSGGA